MYDMFYGEEILDVFAYGKDEFDFTPNLLGFGVSIGETGYAVMKFSGGDLFLSTEGITIEKPIRNEVHQLPTGKFHNDMVGQVLSYIRKKDDEYILQLVDCKPITCYFEKDTGYCDRNYFSIDVFGYE